MTKIGLDPFQKDQVVQTLITHNKGGKWELMKAPE